MADAWNSSISYYRDFLPSWTSHSSRTPITDPPTTHATAALLLLLHPYTTLQGFGWHHGSKDYGGAYLPSAIMDRWAPSQVGELKRALLPSETWTFPLSRISLIFLCSDLAEELAYSYHLKTHLGLRKRKTTTFTHWTGKEILQIIIDKS